MPDAKVPRFSHSGFFVLRTPLLPIEELTGWGEGLGAARAWEQQAGADALERAWTSDVQRLRERLRAIIERPEIVHALYIASPSLQAGIEHWKRDPDGKKGLQAERALVRYFARMAARCTPFGVFSGCSVGRLDDDGPSRLRLTPRARYRTSSRLDFDYLFALTTALRQDPQVALQLRYWPNASLRRVADIWHYTESRLAGAQRSHHLVKLEHDPYLGAALNQAEKGATVAEIAAAVRTAQGEIEPSEDEAREFVLELVQNDVLVPSLSPLVTGASPMDEIIRQVAALPACAPLTEPLQRARQKLAALDEKGLGCTRADYEAVVADLQSLPAKVDPARLCQVDMIKPVEAAQLGKPVIEEMMAALDIASRLGQSGEPDDLRSFREAFVERYDRAMVPLLEALDEDGGIGFGRAPADASPLLRGLPLGGGAHGGGGPDAQATVMRKLLERPPDAKRELEVELQLSDLPPARGAGPHALMLSAVVIADSSEALERGDFRVHFKSAGGPSGARMLGRFCHAEPELERLVREHLREEEALDPDAIHAEIVYLPEGRIGNILARPVLRDYEITYLGRSGAPLERQIPLTDLLVGVVNRRIVLYSRRLQRQVIPRLTSAHGFLNPQLAAVYRFLCTLQHERGGGLPSWSWGALENLDFLPRVRVGRVVLSLARWRLTKDDLGALTKPSGRGARFAAVQELRRKRGLPQWVLFRESDHMLPTDLDNPLSVDALLHVLKRVPTAMLMEMYPAPDQLCATSEEGHFCQELNIPIVRRSEAETAAGDGGKSTRAVPTESRAPAALTHVVVARADRTLAPGSDWLYFKVYGGPAALDEVLVSALPRILEAATGALRRWFFIRYADPRTHLRLRFGGEPERLQREVMPIVTQALNPLLSSGRVWKVQLDTYEREVERYGGLEATRLAEDVFHADSEAILSILRTLAGDEGLDLRWRVGLWGVDALLADCGLEMEARLAAVSVWRDDFAREQGGPATKRALGDRFRAERRKLEGFFWEPPAPDNGLDFAWQAFARRSERVKAAVDAMRALPQGAPLSLTDLCRSYAHMHVNRLVRSLARSHEYVLYDFLVRLYESRIAAQRGRKPSPEPPAGSVSAGSGA